MVTLFCKSNQRCCDRLRDSQRQTDSWHPIRQIANRWFPLHLGHQRQVQIRSRDDGEIRLQASRRNCLGQVDSQRQDRKRPRLLLTARKRDLPYRSQGRCEQKSSFQHRNWCHIQSEKGSITKAWGNIRHSRGYGSQRVLSRNIWETK